MTDNLVFVGCRSPQEAEIALSAIEAYRAGSLSAATLPLAQPGHDATLVDRIEKALRDYPTNPQKELVQRVLFEETAGTWVAFDKLKMAFTAAGLKASQASAALRDLSWQLGQVLPAESLANLDANICIFAERMRSAGSFNYRLTSAGREALSRILKN